MILLWFYDVLHCLSKIADCDVLLCQNKTLTLTTHVNGGDSVLDQGWCHSSIKIILNWFLKRWRCWWWQQWWWFSSSCLIFLVNYIAIFCINSHYVPWYFICLQNALMGAPNARLMPRTWPPALNVVDLITWRQEPALVSTPALGILNSLPERRSLHL